MKVILLSELKGKGGEGDVIDVANGFANNYLLPQRIAIKATPGELKQLEARKKNIAKREKTRVENAEALKAKLDGIEVKVIARVGEEGVLFGSVTTQQIAEAIKTETGEEVDRKRIDILAPIKVAGEHAVSVQLYREIKAEISVRVGASLEDIAAQKTAEAEVATEDEVEEADAEVAENAADAQPAEDAE